MANFERQTMEQITQKMIDWARGATSKLTDFRVGSKTRTVYESVAVIVEDFYDRVFRAIKKSIQQNLYAAYNFTPLPAVNATGTIRLYAQNAPTTDQPFYIPMGTRLQTTPSGATGPITYQTGQDAYIYFNSPQYPMSDVIINGVNMLNWYYVDVPIICTVPGIAGNVASHTIRTIAGAPSGIGAATNRYAITNGLEEESLADQKARFRLFSESRTRGTIPSIEYGATTATVLDDTKTFVQERVKSARVIEGNGTFTIYVWNGVGTASEELVASVQQIIDGYIAPDGTRVWGYKPAGISYDIGTVWPVTTSISFEITPLPGYTVSDVGVSNGNIDLRTNISNAINNYYASLNPGDPLIIAELLSLAKQITGVYDVVMTTPTENVYPDTFEVCVAPASISFIEIDYYS